MMMAIGDGARQSIEARIRSAGTNLVIVMPGSATVGGARLGQGAMTTLDAADAQALGDVPGVAAVSPGVNTRGQVVASAGNWSTQIQGAGDELAAIRSWSLESGSFFSSADVITRGQGRRAGRRGARPDLRRRRRSDGRDRPRQRPTVHGDRRAGTQGPVGDGTGPGRHRHRPVHDGAEAADRARRSWARSRCRPPTRGRSPPSRRPSPPFCGSGTTWSRGSQTTSPSARSRRWPAS